MNGQEWDNLVEFAREYAEDAKLVNEALGIVSVILPTTRQQLGNLWWADPDLAEPTWAALIAATNLDIRRIRFVSFGETLKDIGVTGKPTDKSLDAAMEYLNGMVEDDTLTMAIAEHMDEAPDIIERLGVPGADYFVEALHQAFEDSHPTVRNVVYYYLGSAITGQSTKVYRLKNLVALVTRFLPLGQLKEEPYCWMVLVA